MAVFLAAPGSEAIVAAGTDLPSPFDQVSRSRHGLLFFLSYQMRGYSSLAGMLMIGLVKLIIFSAFDCRSRYNFRHSLQFDVGTAFFQLMPQPFPFL